MTKSKAPVRNNIHGQQPTQAEPLDPNDAQEPPLFFYMPDAQFGEFCQWFPATFAITKAEISKLVGHIVDEADPDGNVTFTCAEQFMMYCKAARFYDTDRQARVLASTSPKEQKALGKNTVGFEDSSWDQVKSEVVIAGNIAKFGQNVHLGRKLLATGNRLLVEAASRDRVWGIGYSEKHAMNHRKHWGENRLGKALMATREHLRSEWQQDAEPWKTWVSF